MGTVFRAHLDNGYDAWAPDNNEDLVTYSDKRGKDSQTTDALSLRARVPMPGPRRVELVSITSYARTELEHSYDGDWGNGEFWKREPYDFDPEEQGWSYDFFDRNLRDRTTFTQEVRLRKEEFRRQGRPRGWRLPEDHWRKRTMPPATSSAARPRTCRAGSRSPTSPSTASTAASCPAAGI